jgi:hypothetical protein
MGDMENGLTIYTIGPVHREILNTIPDQTNDYTLSNVQRIAELAEEFAYSIRNNGLITSYLNSKDKTSCPYLFYMLKQLKTTAWARISELLHDADYLMPEYFELG